MIWRFEQVKEKLQYLINEIFQIAEEYDSTKSYAVGDYCTYEGKILRCTSATSGAFDSSAWTDSVIVMNALKTLKGRMDTAESDISSLSARMGTAEGDIDALETSVSHIGQYVTSNGGSASSISLPASTFKNVCSISLPAGKWIINGSCRFSNVAAGTRHASISTASNTSQSIGTQQVYVIGSMFTLLNPTRMMQLSATTTVYLVAYSNIACTVDNAYLQAFRVK